MFHEMLERIVVSWNSIMTACVESLSMSDGIGYFFRMCFKFSIWFEVIHK